MTGAALKRASNRLVAFDAGVVILNHLGTVTAAEPERPELLGQHWSNRSYFRQILRSASIGLSDIVPDGVRAADVIALAVPIQSDRGEFRGTMAGMFRLGATSASTFYAGIVKLRLVSQGLSNREIADRLVITERTVCAHVSNILAKLHLASRTQAALYALKEGLTSLDDVSLRGK